METETISWRELTGNKFLKALHPAMTSDAGYVSTAKIRKIGDVVPTNFFVAYDYEYMLEYLIRRLCKPLFVLGKEQVLELVSNAWDKQYPYYNEQKLNKKQAS